MNDEVPSSREAIRESADRPSTPSAEQRTRNLLAACRARRGDATVIVVVEHRRERAVRRRYVLSEVW